MRSALVLGLLVCCTLLHWSESQLTARGARPTQAKDRSRSTKLGCSDESGFSLCSDEDWGPKCPSGCRIQGLMDHEDRKTADRVRKIRQMLDDYSKIYGSTHVSVTDAARRIRETLNEVGDSGTTYYQLVDSLKTRLLSLQERINRQTTKIQSLKRGIFEQFKEITRLEVDIDIKIRSCKGSCAKSFAYSISGESDAQLDKKLGSLHSMSVDRIEYSKPTHVFKMRSLKESDPDSLHKSGMTDSRYPEFWAERDFQIFSLEETPKGGSEASIHSATSTPIRGGASTSGTDYLHTRDRVSTSDTGYFPTKGGASTSGTSYSTTGGGASTSGTDYLHTRDRVSTSDTGYFPTKDRGSTFSTSFSTTGGGASTSGTDYLHTRDRVSTSDTGYLPTRDGTSTSGTSYSTTRGGASTSGTDYLHTRDRVSTSDTGYFPTKDRGSTFGTSFSTTGGGASTSGTDYLHTRDRVSTSDTGGYLPTRDGTSTSGTSYSTTRGGASTSGTDYLHTRDRVSTSDTGHLPTRDGTSTSGTSYSTTGGGASTSGTDYLHTRDRVSTSDTGYFPKRGGASTSGTSYSTKTDGSFHHQAGSTTSLGGGLVGSSRGVAGTPEPFSDHSYFHTVDRKQTSGIVIGDGGREESRVAHGLGEGTGGRGDIDDTRFHTTHGSRTYTKTTVTKNGKTTERVTMTSGSDGFPEISEFPEFMGSHFDRLRLQSGTEPGTTGMGSRRLTTVTGTKTGKGGSTRDFSALTSSGTKTGKHSIVTESHAVRGTDDFDPFARFEEFRDFHTFDPRQPLPDAGGSVSDGDSSVVGSRTTHSVSWSTQGGDSPDQQSIQRRLKSAMQRMSMDERGEDIPDRKGHI
ncbi:fibrinogen alpha chain [Callorhinchus milii]|uniref:fibrinogen alpha chain n=1 Tax=Callorhinchus milii TaxID=7868 RepID=UPI001C3F78BA|nr:fibrinogen alpha chain [Callorhinchus milii]